jgi:PAS domain S-box-containing protein
MISGTTLLGALSVPAYMTDAHGRLTFYNDAAAGLWQYRPPLDVPLSALRVRLFSPEGIPLAPDDWPVARLLREGQLPPALELSVERGDGSRVAAIPHASLLYDSDGRVAGTVCLLFDVSQVGHGDADAARLAAIVSSSDDVIISKTLEGVITSWNAAATRVFGYEAEEMVGQSILKIIPPELHAEEERILATLKRGERLSHYDTVRVTKDGRRIDISLTVSPVRDRHGRVIGASKVARDVTERKRAEALQRLLFDELNHRVKNTLAIVTSLASQSLLRTSSPEEFAESFTGRVEALARAHDLLMLGQMRGTTLADLIQEQVILAGGARIYADGPKIVLDSQAVVQVGLVLHELATNARKYGALSVPNGRLNISWAQVPGQERDIIIHWRESGVPNLRPPQSQGFGTKLIERTSQAFGGSATIEFRPGGLACDLRLQLRDDPTPAVLRSPPPGSKEKPPGARPTSNPLVQGGRVLVVEDELIIAMDIEARLNGLGCIVIGPAATAAAAINLIETEDIDAALLDANLGGQRVDDVAEGFARRGIPFAFVTGYGPEALPGAFRDVPVVPKPINITQLNETLAMLMARNSR